MGLLVTGYDGMGWDGMDDGDGDSGTGDEFEMCGACV